MKNERTLEVYDSINKGRLLGHLEVRQEIYGYRYEVLVMPSMSIGMYVAMSLDTACDVRVEKVSFDVSPRSKSNSRSTGPFSRQIVSDEWKVLETSATLETLMKMDCFTLPGEDGRVAEERRYMSDRFSDC